jgi:signal transduction histidine kinase
MMPSQTDTLSTEQLSALWAATLALGAPAQEPIAVSNTLAVLCALTGAERSALFWLDGDGREPVFVAGALCSGRRLTAAEVALQHGCARDAAHLGRSIQAGTTLTLPLVHDDIVIGAVSVTAPAEMAKTAVLLGAFAPHVASILSNARTQAHTQRQANALSQESGNLRDALVTAQEARVEFVRTVSHELKLPMTSIKGYADLLASGAAGPVSDQQRAFLTTISANTSRMAALVSDLSDLAKIESRRIRIDLKAVSAVEVVHATVAQLRKSLDARGQTVQVEAAEDLPQVRTDPGRLGQILTHLLRNASLYSPDGAALTLTLRLQPGALAITVRDPGVGISADDQTRLFTPFWRSDDPRVREHSGWGLGLHLCQQLLSLLGGQLLLVSTLNAGSAFSFTLPVDESHAPDHF